MPKFIIARENKKSTDFLSFNNDCEYLLTFGFDKENELYYFQPLLSKAVKFETIDEAIKFQSTTNLKLTILEMV